MKRFFYLFSVLFVLCVVSACSKSEVHHYNELQFQASLQGITATCQQQSAQGEYWSEDGKSVMMLFENGELQHVDYYTYPDHKLFCRYFMRKSEFYNDKGHKISEALAKASCGPVYEQYKQQRKDLSRMLAEAANPK